MLTSRHTSRIGASTMDLGDWLKALGMAEYEAAFAANGIHAALLPELSNDDLKDLGVLKLADRKQLLKAIAAMGAEVDRGIAGTASGEPEYQVSRN